MEISDHIWVYAICWLLGFVAAFTINDGVDVRLKALVLSSIYMGIFELIYLIIFICS